MIGIRLYRSVGIIAILAVAALPCFAGEVAVLKNGFAIRHERREVVGDVTRLYVNADGSSFVDVPTAQVDHYEAAPDVPAPKAAASGPGQPATAARISASGLNGPSTTNAKNGGAFAATGFSSRRMDLTEVVKDASGRYQLDPDLVNSVIKAESGFNARAISPKGAQGLMQLMPGTATQLGVPNAFDPQANVDGGTKYLRELLEKYNFDLVKALAAYNAGPQRVEHFGGVPPYYETRAYVARIVRDFNKKKLAQQKATAAAKKQATSKEEAAKTHTAATKHGPSGSIQAKAGQQSE
jgi:soluble lytic murein transglycosylase-like protein